MAGEQNLVEIVLGADAKQVSAAVASVTKAMNAAEQTAAAQKRQAEIATNLGRRLADANERIANAARARLSIEDRITQAKDRQARIERRMATETTANQRTALDLARRRNTLEMERLVREQQGSRGGLLRGAMNAVGIGHWADRYDRARDIAREMGGGGAGNTASGVLGGLTTRGAMAVGLPVAIAGGLVYGLHKAGQHLDEQAAGSQKLARRIGIGTGDAQALQYAGTASGIGVDRVEGMMMDLIEAQGQARMGSKDLVEAFGMWGVSLDDIRRKNPVELFRQLTGAIKDGRVTAEQFSVGVRLLGRDFKELGPDVAAITKKMDEFRANGLGIDNGTIENVNSGARLRTAAWARIKAKVGRGVAHVGGVWNAAKDAALYDFGGSVMTAEERQQLGDSLRMRMFGMNNSGEASAMQAKLDAKLSAKKAKQDDQYAAFLEEWDALGEKMDKAAKLREQRGGKSGLGVSEADQLARIGLFRGGLVTADLRIQEQQLIELKAAVTELRALTRMESED